jgi:HK97 family phage prohead protease
MLSRSLEIQSVKKLKKSVRFVASTSGTDRYGDVINQAGWELAAYNRNPVVLLNHNANQLPIGKGKVEVVDGNLMIDIEFDKDDELAAKVESKARNGFMNAVSVGFNPVEKIARSELPEEHKAYTNGAGTYFQKAELLEVSVVTIPANSEATAMPTKQLGGLRSMVREIIAQEVRHILEVEELEDTFKVTFAKEVQEQADEPQDEVEELESYLEDEDEEKEPKDKSAEPEIDPEDDDEQKSMDLNALITLLLS